MALGIACALVVTSSAFDAADYQGVLDRTTRFGTERNYAVTAATAWAYWIGVDYQRSSSLFFTLLPLLVVMPYAWSLRTDLLSGYVTHAMARMSRREYYAAKFTAVFLSAGLATAVPLLLSQVLAFCIAPTTLPLVKDVFTLSLAVMEGMPLYDLFYTCPLAYVLAWTLMDFALSGLWATSVLAVSLVLENRVLLVARSCLFQMAVGFVVSLTVVLLDIPGSDTVFLDLASMLRPISLYHEGQPLASALVVTLMVAVSLGLPALMLGEDLT